MSQFTNINFAYKSGTFPPLAATEKNLKYGQKDRQAILKYIFYEKYADFLWREI